MAKSDLGIICSEECPIESRLWITQWSDNKKKLETFNLDDEELFLVRELFV